MNEKNDKQNTGSQVKQFLGGLAAATKYVLTSRPVKAPADNKYEPDNRQEFHDALNAVGEKKRVQNSEHAQYELNMMKGQNHAQTRIGQPIPKKSIELFVEQVDAHAKLDKLERKNGKIGAPDVEHHKVNMEYHAKLSKVFGDAGYTSGQLLHQVGFYQNAVLKDLKDTDRENLNSYPNRLIFGSQ